MASFDEVLQDVDRRCRDQHVPMLGGEKAKFLADLITQVKPTLIVECGTAIGYSGLWMARTLQTLGSGRIITAELNPERAHAARENFARAGVSHLIDSRIGDASLVLKTVQDPVDFLFLDNGYGNYHPCFTAIASRLVDGATIVADNVGIGADAMADYLSHVRGRYESKTHWFDINLPWVKRDAIEVTVYRKSGQ